MQFHRLAASLTLVALLAGACSNAGNTAAPLKTAEPSASPAPSASALPSPSSSPSGSAATVDPHASESPHLSEKYSPESPPPSGFRSADSGESETGSGRVPLQVSIQPSCVEIGDLVTFTLRTKRDVQVAFLTNLPRNAQGQGEEKRDRSNSSGTFAWTVSVLPGTQPDQYTLFAAAADDKGDDGGRSGKWFFVVAAENGCP